MKNRITENLSWNSIKENYLIGEVVIAGKTVQVNALKEAIDSGAFKQLIVDCADAMYAGDIVPVLQALKHNLSSARTNTKKRPDTPTKAKDLDRIELVWNYVAELLGSAPTATATRQNKSGKVYWTWSLDEINAVPIEDVRTLQSIRDNMASAKSKYPENIEDMDEFLMRYRVACQRYSEAKKLAQQAKQQSAHSAEELDKLIGLLESGRLTKNDKAIIAQVLKDMQK